MDEVLELLDKIEHSQRQSDALELLSIMRNASGYEPHLAGTMVGFGSYHYQYDSGTEGDAFVTGFAARKKNLVVYIMTGFSGIEGKLQMLGKFKTGKSCLYISKLSDIDCGVLAEVISASVKKMQGLYECQSSA